MVSEDGGKKVLVAPRPVRGASREEKLAALHERYDLREYGAHTPGPDAPKTKGPRISQANKAYAEDKLPGFDEALGRFIDANPEVNVDEEFIKTISSEKHIGMHPGLAEAFANGDYDWYLKRSYEDALREREIKNERAYTQVAQNQRLKARGVDVDGFTKFLKACERAEKE